MRKWNSVSGSVRGRRQGETQGLLKKTCQRAGEVHRVSYHGNWPRVKLSLFLEQKTQSFIISGLTDSDFSLIPLSETGHRTTDWWQLSNSKNEHELFIIEHFTENHEFIWPNLSPHFFKYPTVLWNIIEHRNPTFTQRSTNCLSTKLVHMQPKGRPPRKKATIVIRIVFWFLS